MNTLPGAGTASHGAMAAQVKRADFINILGESAQAPPSLKDLYRLAIAMNEPPHDPADSDTVFNNPEIPAGYTYFSQFVDHDLTGQNQNALRQRPPGNLRSAAFDLDSMYGDESLEPTQEGLLHAVDDPAGMFAGARFRLTERNVNGVGPDLPAPETTTATLR